MESYSGLLPFLWKTFKKPPPQQQQQQRKPVPLSHLHDIQEDRVEHEDDDEYFLHPELVIKSPARFAKSPSMFGRSPSMFGRSPSMFGRSPSMFGRSPRRAPNLGHKRRHSNSGLGGFSLPKLLSSHSQRAR